MNPICNESVSNYLLLLMFVLGYLSMSIYNQINKKGDVQRNMSISDSLKGDLNFNVDYDNYNYLDYEEENFKFKNISEFQHNVHQNMS